MTIPPLHSSALLLPVLLIGTLLGERARAEAPVQPGDRIAVIGNTFADQLRIHGYLETLLLQNHDVSIRNLGWAGDMLTARDRPTGFPTEELTLTDHRTDMIIACFGMGESFAGDDGLEDFKADLKAFLKSHKGKKYNGKSEVRLVLVSPIAYENHGSLTPALEKRNRDLKAYTAAMSQVATAEKIQFIDLYEPSRYLMNEAGQTKLTSNGIHLNDLGYWAISHPFYEQLTGQPSRAWRLVLDAKAVKATAGGVEISELNSNQGTLEFSVIEKSPPSVTALSSGELPVQLASKRDTLVVTGLEPGNYMLTIDKVNVITASHLEWAKGVAIDTSPAHEEAQRFRDAVNNKNLQFTYSWKALNQVHIVGERRNSPSGRALPEEIIEFHKLANRIDRNLRDMIKLKTRQWRLAPVKD